MFLGETSTNFHDGSLGTIAVGVDELHVLRAWSDDSICANFGHLKVQFDRRSGALAAASGPDRPARPPANRLIPTCPLPCLKTAPRVCASPLPMTLPVSLA